MPDLNFQMEGVEPVPFAAVPTLMFRLAVTDPAPSPNDIHTVVLRAQIQIDVTRRRYSSEEQVELQDLFGSPERWSQTLRSLLWTHVSVVVRGFRGKTSVDLPVPCTFDFNVAATKYFNGLRDGDLPLVFLFSGTVFYPGENGALQVSPISWEKEARFALPVRTWRQLIDDYYPNSAWLCLRREVFDSLDQYKKQHGIPTWDQAVTQVLDLARETSRP